MKVGPKSQYVYSSKDHVKKFVNRQGNELEGLVGLILLGRIRIRLDFRVLIIPWTVRKILGLSRPPTSNKRLRSHEHSQRTWTMGDKQVT